MNIAHYNIKNSLSHKILYDGIQFPQKSVQKQKRSIYQQQGRKRKSKNRAKDFDRYKMSPHPTLDRQNLLKENLQLKEALNIVLEQNIKLRTKVLYLMKKINRQEKNAVIIGENEYHQLKKNQIQNEGSLKKDNEKMSYGSMQAKRMFIRKTLFGGKNTKQHVQQSSQMIIPQLQQKKHEKPKGDDMSKAQYQKSRIMFKKHNQIELDPTKQVSFLAQKQQSIINYKSDDNNDDMSDDINKNIKLTGKSPSEKIIYPKYNTLHNKIPHKKHLIVNLNISQKKLPRVNVSHLNQIVQEQVNFSRKSKFNRIKSVANDQKNINQSALIDQIQSNSLAELSIAFKDRAQQNEKYKQLYKDLRQKLQKREQQIQKLQRQYKYMKLKQDNTNPVQQDNKKQVLGSQKIGQYHLDLNQIEQLKKLLRYRLFGFKFNFNDLKQSLQSINIEALSYKDLSYVLVDKPFYLNVPYSKIMMSYLFNKQKPAVDDSLSMKQLLIRLRDLIVDFNIIQTNQQRKMVKKISQLAQKQRQNILTQIQIYKNQQNEIDENSLRQILSNNQFNQDEIFYILSQLSIYSNSMNQLKYSILFEQSSFEKQSSSVRSNTQKNI